MLARVSWPAVTTTSVAGTLARRRGQAGRNLLRVLDGQYYFVVLAVGQVDDDPGVVAVADGG
jgi:hypothetical protein